MLKELLFFIPFPLFYLLGAIPTGYLVARSQGIDIYKTGSGNLGATNVARVLGKKLGLITLLVDSGKGLAATCIANFISHGNLSYMALAALICVAGHCFSIPGKLNGGKGVATALGTLLGLNYLLAIIAVATFLITIIVFRIVSVSSLTATATVVIAANLLGLPQEAWYSLAIMSLLIFYRHKDNLRRLSRGEEKKFSFSKN